MDAIANVIEITVQNFQEEVLEKSKQVPVLVEFYAESAEQSVALTPVLRRLANEYQGKFILARVDIQQNQQIVQQLGVRTLPTLKAIFQGQMAKELEGPQEEIALRQMLDELTMSPIERIQEHIRLLLSEGNRVGAIEMLQQAIVEEPTNYALQVELADLLVMENRIDEAQVILGKLAPDTAGINKPTNRIGFIGKAAGLRSIDELKSADANDLKNQYELAIMLIVEDKIENALTCLLAMLKHDPSFEDELARKTMIKVFDLLGRGDPLATGFRRKMFALLH